MGFNVIGRALTSRWVMPCATFKDFNQPTILKVSSGFWA